MFGAYLEHAQNDNVDRGRAKYEVAIICEQCDQGWRDSAGRRFALDADEVARARCDARHIGSLDTAAPPRATQDVPPRTRRLVWRRDRGACTLDGCRSAANIELHHIVPRSQGGTNEPSNLTLACDGCHTLIHRGLMTVTGTAPDAIVVKRKHPPRAHVRAALDRVSIDVDAKAALVQAGYSKGEAAAAVAAVRAETTADLALEDVLLAALRVLRLRT